MEQTLSVVEILVVLAVAVVGFAFFGYWLRNSVLLHIAKKDKTKRLTVQEGPRWVGPGYSRKQRRC